MRNYSVTLKIQKDLMSTYQIILPSDETKIHGTRLIFKTGNQFYLQRLSCPPTQAFTTDLRVFFYSNLKTTTRQQWTLMCQLSHGVVHISSHACLIKPQYLHPLKYATKNARKMHLWMHSRDVFILVGSY